MRCAMPAARMAACVSGLKCGSASQLELEVLFHGGPFGRYDRKHDGIAQAAVDIALVIAQAPMFMYVVIGEINMRFSSDTRQKVFDRVSADLAARTSKNVIEAMSCPRKSEIEVPDA